MWLRKPKAYMMVLLGVSALLAFCLLSVEHHWFWRKALTTQDQDRYEALSRIVTALQEYHKKQRSWPPGLQSLRELNPDLVIPDSAGPERLDYRVPHSEKDIMLISYGHDRMPPHGDVGIELPMAWLFRADGQLSIVDERDVGAALATEAQK